MSNISEIGGVPPVYTPALRFAERQTAGTGDQMLSLLNAQAKAQASGTPAAGAGSNSTGSQADKGAGQGEATKPVLLPGSFGDDLGASAITQTVVQAQIAFLVAPPFDGEPSPQTIAEAQSAAKRFQLLIEALGKRADAVATAKPAAAVEQENGVSVANTADGLPV